MSEWLDHYNIYLNQAGYAYSGLSVASTLVSVYSIRKIFVTTKQLSATNDKVSLKNNTLLIHAALIVLSCSLAVYKEENKKYVGIPRLYIAVLCTLSTLDLIVQLFMCYICIKFGANDNLNRFDCCLVDDGNGGYQIKFIPRQSVPTAIGVPHAANEVNDQDDDVMNETVDNEFTRTESLWRDRRRGMSLTNSRECNEIVR